MPITTEETDDTNSDTLETLEGGTDTVLTWVRQQPITALLTSLVVGIVIGRLVL